MSERRSRERRRAWAKFVQATTEPEKRAYLFSLPRSEAKRLAVELEKVERRR